VLEQAGEVEKTVPWRQRLGLARKDVEIIAATYAAGFVATLTFLA